MSQASSRIAGGARRVQNNGSREIRATYVDIDRLQSANGITAVLSQRRKDGKITYAIFREWPQVDDDGTTQVQRGAFMSERHIDSHMEMLRMVRERIAHFHANPDELPFPLLQTERSA